MAAVPKSYLNLIVKDYIHSVADYISRGGNKTSNGKLYTDNVISRIIFKDMNFEHKKIN